MNLAIFEPTATGHNMILYVRHIVREAFRRDWRVTLVTTEKNVDDPSTMIVREESGNRLHFFCLEGIPDNAPSSRLGMLRLQWTKYRAFAKGYQILVRNDKPDAIIVPCLDQIFQILRMAGSPFGSTPFSGILVNSKMYLPCVGGGSWHSLRHWIDLQFFMHFLQNSKLLGCATTNEPFYEHMRNIFPKALANLYFVPECASLNGIASRQEARSFLKIKGSQRVILFYGSIRPSKGLNYLLRAMRHPACSSQAILLIAGRFGSYARSMLKSQDACTLRRNGRIIEVEVQGSFKDETEWQLFSAADMVWVGYTDVYGMSGVLVQAGSVGLPVIACHEGLIGWVCRKYNLGECVDVHDPVCVAETISFLSINDDLRADYKKQASDFAHRHSPENFARLICNTVAHD